jgi:hypothetical protein
MQSRDNGRGQATIVRAFVASAVAVAVLVTMADSADARPWRRGWPGYYGWGPYWGYPYWGFPPGGYYGPSNVWYVPPLAPDKPAVVLPRQRCAAGRAPARWVKTKKDGREVYQHVMSRCR